jgi:hypothetical protein
VRRLKTYSAQSGYVYQYYYDGHRPFGTKGATGTDYVFSVSPDAKQFHPVSVMVSDAAVADWEKANGRELSSSERYAVAKMALFQAFDERTKPDQMREEVRVRSADVAGIIQSLDL